MKEAVMLQASRMQFIGRQELGGFHWSVVETSDKHMTEKRAVAGLKAVVIPPHACDGSELTFIFSNTRGIYRLYAVLEKGKWVKVKTECVKT